MSNIEGQIEKVVYHNPENSYTVASLKEFDKDIEVVIVGKVIQPREGDCVKVSGKWSSHPKYGKQLQFTSCTKVIPQGVTRIKQYLGSGVITGIGPELADRIVKMFGNSTLDVLDNDIARLMEVSGIKKKKLKMIQDSYEKEKKIRELVFFLQDNEINTNLATKIYMLYGDLAIGKIKENPYILIKDISGVGFKTADNIAEKLGIPKDSVFRAEAALYHTLNVYADKGHTYSPVPELVDQANELIDQNEDLLYTALDNLKNTGKVIIDNTFDEERAYLAIFHVAENGSAKYFNEICSVKNTLISTNIDDEIAKIESISKIKLAEEQILAIKAVFENKFVVITGGPGTGKSTIIDVILKIYEKTGFISSVALAAPTGKAAKRMTEITGIEAKTIHRLLEYDPIVHRFVRNQYNKLYSKLIIIDEASMIDITLFYSLLKAIPSDAVVVFVGDVNQLPSVGVGNVLKDIISSNKIPVIMLNKIFRQAEKSNIIVNSHRVNNGQSLKLDSNSDFYYIENSNSAEIRKLVVDLVTKRIPKKFGYDPMNDIQVLVPMYKGDVGINILNVELQKNLNDRLDGVIRGQFKFSVGDKVMQIKNNYDKEILNGDVGYIRNIFPDRKEMIIMFDGKDVVYPYSDLDELVLAYATSVHKSQGSEFPVVIMPLTMQHYMLLQRNLLYTGITRGKKLVILIGEKSAIDLAIRNNKTQFRYTALNQFINHI